jgi:hypothetical protein
MIHGECMSLKQATYALLVVAFEITARVIKVGYIG